MTEGTDVRHERSAVDQDGAAAPPRRRFLMEAILDNLAAWAFVALVIAALFMVWATLVILETYVGELPAVKP